MEGVQPHHRRARGPAGSPQSAAGPAGATAGGGQDAEQRQRRRRAQFTRAKLGKSCRGVDEWSAGERSLNAEQLQCVKGEGGIYSLYWAEYEN